MPGAEQTFVHRIDANDDIVAVDDAWRQFAAENGAPQLAERAVGVSLWRFVLGDEVRRLYEHLLDGVRERAGRASVPYRCDSPSVRRFMRLDVLPLAGGQVEFRSSLLREERRDPVDILGSAPSRADWSILSCSWCRRFRTSRWVEVEEAIAELGLFDSVSGPRISHGVCEDCLNRVLEAEVAGGSEGIG